jgi:hypothetical protein
MSTDVKAAQQSTDEHFLRTARSHRVPRSPTFPDAPGVIPALDVRGRRDGPGMPVLMSITYPARLSDGRTTLVSGTPLGLTSRHTISREHRMHVSFGRKRPINPSCRSRVEKATCACGKLFGMGSDSCGK